MEELRILPSAAAAGPLMRARRERLVGGRAQLFLDAASELILPFGGYERIFAGHLQIAVASDLRSFDSAAADLLTPRDIRTPERVRPEAFEVAPPCLMPHSF